MINIRTAVHEFSDLETAAFKPAEYSQLKFGSDTIANKYGVELARDTFAKHKDALLSRKLVVIPSPYHHVRKSATIMTQHFINEINHLLVSNGGSPVEYSIIHRKMSYVKDYGFLSKEMREKLIQNDKFYLNSDYYENKFLLFIDDVRITGTHEARMSEMLTQKNIQNDRMFLYYASYTGDDPLVESRINFAGLSSIHDYIKLAREPNHHVIIRPIKFVLSLDMRDFELATSVLHKDTLKEMYHGALGEEYYNVPEYQTNFNLLKQKI